jgi:TfoX/Sxy family transcriptional regulator of competence genes
MTRTSAAITKSVWKKVPPELDAFLAESLAPFACEKRSMFGCPVYFVNKNMFAGLHQDNLFIRLSAEDRDKLFATFDEAAVFEPMAGRPMKEYAVIPESLYNDSAVFTAWLNRSHTYVATLPEKKKKPPRKK